MIRPLLRSQYFYGIVKQNNGIQGRPLPNMDMFYLTDPNHKQISFWNDLPISMKGDTLTCCIEVPKQLSNKYEVIKELKNHPLMQDTKKNVFSKEIEFRFYAQFPLFNYGFIPRTWEQTLTKDELGLFGDDDPIDICDLSHNKKSVGQVFQGKVLGCFCLIDQGEVDWKILTVDAEEAKVKKIETIQDFPRQQIQAVMQWFKTIKVFDGKKANSIAYNQKIFSKDESLSIVYNTHQEWIKLASSEEEVYKQLREKFHMTDFKL